MAVERVEKGVLFITGACLASAVFGMLVKLSSSSLAIPLLILTRFVIPFIICLPIFYVAGTFKKIGGTRHLISHWLRALFVVLSQYCYFFYLTKSSLLNATMLFNTAPIYIPLVSRFIFKDQSVKVFSKSLLVSLLGVVLLMRPDDSLLITASWIGVLSGVFLGVSQSIYGENVHDDTLDENLFYMFLFSSCLAFIALAIIFAENLTDGFELLILQPLRQWGFIILIGLCTITSQFFRGLAFINVKPYLLAPLMNLAVFFAFIFDIFVFKNAPDYLSIMGSLLIVSGSLMKWHSLRKS